MTRAEIKEVIGRALCGLACADTPIPYRLLNDGTRVRVVDDHDYQDGTIPYWEWFHGHQATVALSALEASGLAVVPVEPTTEMYRAAYKLQDDCAIQNYGGSPAADDYWYAMIAATKEPHTAP